MLAATAATSPTESEAIDPTPLADLQAIKRLAMIRDPVMLVDMVLFCQELQRQLIGRIDTLEAEVKALRR